LAPGTESTKGGRKDRRGTKGFYLLDYGRSGKKEKKRGKGMAATSPSLRKGGGGEKKEAVHRIVLTPVGKGEREMRFTQTSLLKGEGREGKKEKTRWAARATAAAVV